MNNSPHLPLPLILALLLFLLLPPAQADYQAVNWGRITKIKSGDQKLLLQPISESPFTFPQNYDVTFSAPPQVLIAMRNLAIDYTNQSVDFHIIINNTLTTGSQFTTVVTAPNNLTITLLYFMYIAIDKTYPYTYFLYYSQNLSLQLNNSLTLNTTITQDINTTITQYTSAKVIPFVISFAMGANSTEYSVAATGAMASPTSIGLTILSNSSLSRVELMVVLVDVYSYTIGYYNYFDIGYLQQFNNGASFTQDFNPPSTDYYNIISGISSFRLPKDKAISFYLMINRLYNSTTSYIQLKVMVLQWRFRQCINSSMLYFAPEQGRCYDNCSNSVGRNYGQNTTYKFCATCSISCEKCSGAADVCTSCVTADKRVLNTTTQACECISGYYEAGFKACPACHYTCLTCANTATTCLSCSSGRSITNSTCPCDAATYDPLTGNATCLACDQKCATCQAEAANCTSCGATTNRILDTHNMKCPCGSGYKENGTATCIDSPFNCTPPCTSCLGTPTTCNSCDSNQSRILVSTQCVCKDGFTSSSATACIQTCGDGKLLTNTYQCDDGNTRNGDGCSSSCMIETGFTCTNSNSTSPASLCTSDSGYSINYNSLIRDTSSNQMTASLTFSPTPPVSVTPSLQTLQDQLSINSFNFDAASSTMSIILGIRQQITADSFTISFSLINQTTNIPLSATNNLQLKPYSNFQLNAYKAQTYLVWIFIGLLWIGSIIFVAFVDVRSFNGVFQLFMFVCLAWVGVEGQQLYSLLFVPLKNLRYIFGMNLQLSTDQGLFSVFNIGCIYFLLPFLGFIVIVLVNKRQAYAVSSKTKRFVLMDILYAWLMINGFLIVYGMSLSINTQEMTSTAIGGIVLGSIYLLVCFAASWKLFTRRQQVQINPKLAISKKNLFRPQLYALTVNLYLIFSLLYLSISKSLKINSIVMIGCLFGMFLLFALGNILISKIKYMLNLAILIFIYGCVLLYNNVGNAVWSGLAVTALLYIQLAINFLFLVFQKGKSASVHESEKASDTVKVDYEMNQMNMGVDVEREAEFEDGLDPPSENKSALEGQYEKHFTVYEPTIKKPPLEIMINPPENLYETTNAIETAMKTYTGRSERERLLLDKRPNHYVTPKNRREVDDEDVIDFEGREVEMDAI